MHDGFNIVYESQNDPSRFYFIYEEEILFILQGRTINDLFHIWEPRSNLFALITMHSMGKQVYKDDDTESEKVGNVENENFHRGSGDLQQIRGQDLPPNPMITNSITISPNNYRTLPQAVRQKWRTKRMPNRQSKSHPSCSLLLH
jgi:hypothetical protein